MTPAPAEIAADLRELSPDECVDSKRRTKRNPNGIRHSSTDHHYTALSDADADEHCLRALRSAARRQGL
jgi:hypothetical protein